MDVHFTGDIAKPVHLLFIIYYTQYSNTKLVSCRLSVDEKKNNNKISYNAHGTLQPSIFYKDI